MTQKEIDIVIELVDAAIEVARDRSDLLASIDFAKAKEKLHRCVTVESINPFSP